jgi:hypothetical protein
MALTLQGDRLPPGGHAATVDEIELALVDAFPASKTRRPLFEQWRNVVAAIERILPIQEHWMDGSYVTAKLDPNDIDIVTYLDHQDFDGLDDVAKTLLAGLVSNKVSQALHGCDSYWVVAYPEGHPLRAAYEQSRSYWEHWLGTDRTGNPKGYVELLRQP